MGQNDSKIIVFEDKKIRRIWHDNEWYFSVVDIVGTLTESSNPNNYWKVLKHREKQLVTICNQLKLQKINQRVVDKLLPPLRFNKLQIIRRDEQDGQDKYVASNPVNPVKKFNLYFKTFYNNSII